MSETVRHHLINEALAEVCTLLMDEYELSLKEITTFAAQLPKQCSDIDDNRNEAAWQRQQESLMESGGPDNSHYRKSMIEAGRGHLLRDGRF